MVHRAVAYLLSRVAQHIRLTVDGDGINPDERFRAEVDELLVYPAGGAVRDLVRVENLQLDGGEGKHTVRYMSHVVMRRRQQ